MPIILENVNYTYQKDTPFEAPALNDINMRVGDGELIGLIGHTGSGKSTLVQIMNGLLKPSSGRVIVDGIDLGRKGIDLKRIRQRVGLVFQYPEHQLFEESVRLDIAFGPKNLGLSEEEIEERVRWAMDLVNLEYGAFAERSPFELSGGQMRRVAIAGVLAMKPRYLILDEPTAGLDPRGRDEILGEILRIHKDLNITVILVSHHMEDVARFSNRLIVMNMGSIFMEGGAREIFAQAERLREIGLGIPQVTEIMLKLRERGKNIRSDLLTVDEGEEYLLRMIKGEGYDQ